MQYVDENRQKLLETVDAGAHLPFCDLLDAGALDWRTMPAFYPLGNRSDGFEGPVQIQYEGQQTWSIPRQVHPLSKLLSQVARPKWWNLSRQRPSEIYNAGLGDVQLANTADGAPLGTIAALDRDALRALLEHPHCGAESMDDDTGMRGRLEVKASKIHIVPWNGSLEPSSPRISSEEDWDWAIQYYSDCDSEDDRPIWDPLSVTGRMSPQPQTLPPPNPFTALATQIQQLLFPGRPVTLRFCELALYYEDHHFQLHRDSTHSRVHYGTLLIPCGIKGQWNGSDVHLRVALRSEGEEAVFSLRIGDALAFCTDVHHGVSPIKSGTQATLQFDICLEDCTGPDDDDTIDAAMRHNAVTCIKTPTPALPSACVTCRTGSPLHGCDDRDTGGANITGYTHWHARQQWTRLRDPQFNELADAAVGPLVLTVAAVDVVHQFVREVTSLLRYGEAIPLAPPRTVIFLLSHLPRCMGIQPAYLKGADAALYQALTSSGELKVFLNHVTYFRYSWEKPTLAPCPPFAPPFTIKNPPVFPEPVLVLDKGGEADHVDQGQILDSEGNSHLDSYWQYFAGAMFVTLARDG